MATRFVLTEADPVRAVFVPVSDVCARRSHGHDKLNMKRLLCGLSQLLGETSNVCM